MLICVAEDARKKVPSSVGMRRGVETSELLKFRAEEVVPRRADDMVAAIAEKDFEAFARITMKDSNQVRNWQCILGRKSRSSSLSRPPAARGLPGHLASVRLHERHLARRGRPRRGDQRRGGRSSRRLHFRRRPERLHLHQGGTFFSNWPKWTDRTVDRISLQS